MKRRRDSRQIPRLRLTRVGDARYLVLVIESRYVGIDRGQSVQGSWLALGGGSLLCRW